MKTSSCLLSIVYPMTLALAILAQTTTTQTSFNGNVYTFTDWTLDLTGPDSIAYFNVRATLHEDPVQISYSTMELMAHSVQYNTSAVVDIIYVNDQPNGNFTNDMHYQIPANLPIGFYLVRTNVSYTSTSGNHVDTVSFPLFFYEGSRARCASLVPYKNVTSLSDPNYSSLHITYPYAGAPQYIFGPITAYPEWSIQWDFYDTQNAGGNGIKNLSMEFVRRDGGMIQSAGAFQVNPSSTSMDYPFNAETVSSAVGLWYIRANYTNVAGAGARTNSSTNVTYWSEPFYISFANGTGYNCSCTDGSVIGTCLTSGVPAAWHLSSSSALIGCVVVILGSTALF